ncbi:MAG TPA: DUF177 domain-containing protein [Pyrinomonadaceae bacterium]|jgi:uncharacterized protein
MRIELENLEQTGDAFEHTYQPDELDLEEEHARLTGPAEVRGRVSRSGQEVRLRGKIRAAAEVDCDRCLSPAPVAVETAFDVGYIPVEAYTASEAAELQEADLSLSIFDGATIDVDELVREQVLLELPARALCAEDCRGLCPACGSNRNTAPCSCQSTETDPRWAALEKLVNPES